MMKPRKATLTYSEKAVRQVQGMPTHDCGEHPDTTYAKVPDHLREHMADPTLKMACSACLAALAAKVANKTEAQDMDKRAKEKAEAAERKATEERALAAQKQLRTVYEEAINWEASHAKRLRQAEEAHQGAVDSVGDSRREAERLDQEMLALRQRMAKARTRLQERQAAVQTAQDALADVQMEAPFALSEIQAALDTSERTFGDCRPRFARKKVDRALRKKVKKLLKAVAQ